MCYQRTRRGAWAQCHPDRLRSRRSKILCRPCYFEQVTRPQNQRYARARKLRVYGLTPEQYDAMVLEQGGVCAICRGTGAQELHVDHDHATGRIRGLLCVSCNRMLGLAKDDPARLIAAAGYLGGTATAKAARLLEEALA